MDHLLLSTEKSTTIFKSQNILQETNVGNLITSDSLPDIFRKPITQQSTDTIFNNLPKMNEEEKVSKWGYGPSTLGDCPLGSNKPTLDYTKDTTVKFQTETTFETPKMLSKFANPSTVSSKIRHPLVNQFEKSAAVDTFQPNSTLELLQNHTRNSEKQSNHSTTSLCNTASNLYNTTQPTVKCLAKDKEIDKTSELLCTTSSINRPAPSTHSKTIQSNIQPTAIAPSTNLLPCSNKVLPVEPVVIEVSKPKIIEEEPIVKMPPPPADDRPLQRPATKHKQITVNGKIYTVMKLLGRGGSSVVYQVCHYNYA